MKKSLIAVAFILIGNCLGAATSEQEKKPFLGLSVRMTKTEALEWIQQQQTLPDFSKRISEFRESCTGIQVEFADLYGYGLSPTSGIFTDLVWHRRINLTDRFVSLFRDTSRTIFEAFYSDLSDNLIKGRITSLSLDMDDFPIDQPDVREKFFHNLKEATNLQTITLKGNDYRFTVSTLQSLDHCPPFETLKLEGVLDDVSLIAIADELKTKSLKGLSITIPEPGLLESGPTSNGYSYLFNALKSCKTIQFFGFTAPFLSSAYRDPILIKPLQHHQSYLVDFLNNSNVTHFYITGSGGQCMCALLAALLTNPKIESMNIGNVWNECDCITLIYHLYQNKTLQSLSATPRGYDSQILNQLISERFGLIKENGQ